MSGILGVVRNVYCVVAVCVLCMFLTVPLSAVYDTSLYCVTYDLDHDQLSCKFFLLSRYQT